MVTDRELMQMALEALETICGLRSSKSDIPAVMNAIRERLAQPQLEVVGHGTENGTQYLNIKLRDIAIEEIRKAEREACARVCEEIKTQSDAEFFGAEFAAAIRARGEA